MSAALVLAGALALGSLKTQQFQLRVEAGRHAGEAVAQLRDGVVQYVRDHHQVLASAARGARATDCAKVHLFLASAPPVDRPAGCELTLRGRPVRNAFQPTAMELYALGYVQTDRPLAFPHGSTIVDAETGQAAPARWAMVIHCVVSCTPDDTRAPVFAVMLFNTQPFYPDGVLPFGARAQLVAMRRALGPDGLLSMPGESARAAHTLEGPGGPIANPLRTGTRDEGVAGVVAAYRLVHGTTAPAAHHVCRQCDGPPEEVRDTGP